jgi:hypothetical protein
MVMARLFIKGFIMETKYPHITVRLTGINGNAFSILGACRRAAERARLPQEEIDAFFTEAKSDDYDHLIQTAMRWFNID